MEEHDRRNDKDAEADDPEIHDSHNLQNDDGSDNDGDSGLYFSKRNKALISPPVLATGAAMSDSCAQSKHVRIIQPSCLDIALLCLVPTQCSDFTEPIQKQLVPRVAPTYKQCGRNRQAPAISRKRWKYHEGFIRSELYSFTTKAQTGEPYPLSIGQNTPNPAEHSPPEDGVEVAEIYNPSVVVSKLGDAVFHSKFTSHTALPPSIPQDQTEPVPHAPDLMYPTLDEASARFTLNKK